MLKRFVLPVSELFEELLLISHLSFDLIREMGSRLLWVWMTIRFIIYVALLIPAFWRTAFIFLISDYIIKGVPYGKNPRNYLDIYVPFENNANGCKNNGKERKKPVVIFISGGAWIIGYKAWGAFMGMLLSQMGIVFVSPDYRNFPQGKISDMIEDVSTAIEWIVDNIHLYGGDKSCIYVIAQSAGAHICTLSLLNQAYLLAHKKKLMEQKSKPCSDPNEKNNHFDENIQAKKWKPEDFKAYIGIAGPYNLVELKEYFNRKGLYIDVVLHVMENDFHRYSPFYQLYMDFIPNNKSPFKAIPLEKINFDPQLPYISLVQSKCSNNDLNKTASDDKCFHSSLSCGKNTFPTQNSHYTISDLYTNNLYYFFRKTPCLKKKKHPNEVINHIPNDIECLNNNCDCPYINYANKRPKYPLVLCPMYLFHGERDQSVPVDGTITFAKHLAKYNVETYVKIYPFKTHTGPIVEDPIEGKDPLVCDILRVMFPNQSLEDTVETIENAIRGNLKIPKCIITFARHICPF